VKFFTENKYVWFFILRFFYFKKLFMRIFASFQKKKEKQVFCIGWKKTGTTTMDTALTILGYKTIDWIPEEFPPKEGWMRHLEKWNYEAFTDSPMMYVYKDLYKAYPDAKFILTIRTDRESWKASAKRFFTNTCWAKTFKDLDARADEMEKHEKDVRAFFKGKNNFLILDLFSGDAWPELCEFLNKPIPKVKFPHENRTK